MLCLCYFAQPACCYQYLIVILINSSASITDCEMLNIHLLTSYSYSIYFLSPLLSLQHFIFHLNTVHCVLFLLRLEFSQKLIKILCLVKSFFTKAETQQTRECCWAWPYLPGPLLRVVTGEDGHGDHGCQMLFPWCRRMIGFMDQDSALWQRRGRLCHTWEKKQWQDVKCYWTRSFQGSF